MILSVLIPTLTERKPVFNVLNERLLKLSEPFKDKVQILSLEDNRQSTTGKKRNQLIDMAQGKYSVFIDDDDDVPDWYFTAIFNAIDVTPDLDCIGFKGFIYWNGQKSVFKHNVGLPYSDGKVNGEYLRPPNHLNPMLTEYFKEVRFPDLTFAEDYDFCLKLSEKKLIKKCVFIDLIMYYYKYTPK